MYIPRGQTQFDINIMKKLLSQDSKYEITYLNTDNIGVFFMGEFLHSVVSLESRFNLLSLSQNTLKTQFNGKVQ